MARKEGLTHNKGRADGQKVPFASATVLHRRELETGRKTSSQHSAKSTDLVIQDLFAHLRLMKYPWGTEK